MRFRPSVEHEWSLPPSEAVRLQKELASRVSLSPLPDDFRPRLVAGVDMAFPSKRTGLAAAVLFDTDTWSVVETADAHGPVETPYIPGLLSFRECPLALEALSKLRNQPDVVIADGQGIAHPRRLGFAAHLGLWLGLPTMGCAKSILCGRPEGDLSVAAGSWTRLMHRDEQVGLVFRTRSGVKPVYLSPGHLVDFPGVLRLMEVFTGRFRLPEPVRLAHLLASRLRREKAV